MLRSLRQFLEPDFEIVGEAQDGEELKRVADTLRPELIVTDISMPKLSGIEAAKEILKSHPEIRLIFLTVHNDLELARRSLAIGAHAYVLKNHASMELYDAIRRVEQGQTYVSPSVR